jgi:sugar phosphate isomerase/epimerase
MSSKMKISVQLYTVRDHTAKDFAGTVKSLASFGLQGVELAGYGNLKTAAEVRKAVADVGLLVSGGHIMLDALLGDGAKKVMDDFDTLGCKHIIVPWINEERRNSVDAWKKFAAELVGAGKTLATRGFTLSYHNHDFEFAKFEGQYGLDLLFASAEPAYLASELDLYWVARAGVDPVAYLKKLGTRVQAVHLKDMDKADRTKFTQVGAGQLDFVALLKTCNELSIAWGAIEQDNCYDVDPLQAVRISAENLKKLGAL